MEKESKDHENIEQELRESEEKLRLIMENANDMIAVINSKFRFDYVNEIPHMQLLGYTKDEMMEINSLDLIHPDDIKLVIELGKIIIGRKGEFTQELRLGIKTGNIHGSNARAN